MSLQWPDLPAPFTARANDAMRNGKAGRSGARRCGDVPDKRTMLSRKAFVSTRTHIGSVEGAPTIT
jgi:hypothetical protein